MVLTLFRSGLEHGFVLFSVGLISDKHCLVLLGPGVSTQKTLFLLYCVYEGSGWGSMSTVCVACNLRCHHIHLQWENVLEKVETSTRLSMLRGTALHNQWKVGGGWSLSNIISILCFNFYRWFLLNGKKNLLHNSNGLQRISHRIYFSWGFSVVRWKGFTWNRNASSCFRCFSCAD